MTMNAGGKMAAQRMGGPKPMDYPWDQDALAYLSKCSGATDSYKASVNKLIVRIKRASAWDAFVCGYLFCSPGPGGLADVKGGADATVGTDNRVSYKGLVSGCGEITFTPANGNGSFAGGSPGFILGIQGDGSQLANDATNAAYNGILSDSAGNAAISINQTSGKMTGIQNNASLTPTAGFPVIFGSRGGFVTWDSPNLIGANGGGGGSSNTTWTGTLRLKAGYTTNSITRVSFAFLNPKTGQSISAAQMQTLMQAFNDFANETGCLN